MYARRDVPLYLTQFLGRWGGPTIFIYVGEALQGQLAKQSASGAASSGSQGEGFLGSWAALKREVIRLARRAAREVATRPAAVEAPPTADEVKLAGLAGRCLPPSGSAAPGVPHLPAMRVRGRRGKREVGEIHAVAIGDSSFPPETWTTRCGWRFASSEHSMLDGGEVSCGRCIASLTKDNRTPDTGTPE